MELVGETLRAALNAIATAAPAWLHTLAPPVWYERYSRRIEDFRLPKTPPGRETLAGEIGDDGYRLLAMLDAPEAPPGLASLPAIEALRTVWRRHFETSSDPDAPPGSGRAHLRPVSGRGSEDRLDSPYDTDAGYRSKNGQGWTGYMVHLSETCDNDTPHLIVHADTTAANVHEAMRTVSIHAELAATQTAPAIHLVDPAYVSAAHLVVARETFAIDLVDLCRENLSWQQRQDESFRAGDFRIDWEANRATCPRGKESQSWHAKSLACRYEYSCRKALRGSAHSSVQLFRRLPANFATELPDIVSPSAACHLTEHLSGQACQPAPP